MAFIPPAIAAISAAASTATAAVGTGIAGASSLADASLGAITGISTASVPITTAPGWLSTVGEIGTGLNLVGGAIGAAGAIKASNASASAAKYNSQVASQNSQQAIQNANLTSASGSVAAGNESLKTRALVGSEVANEAASGLDVNSGSPVDVRGSTRSLGELDALTVRSNATREAYGYQVESASQKGQAGLDKSEATSDLTSGYVNAGSTLLGSAGTAATNFAKFQLQGGFSA